MGELAKHMKKKTKKMILILLAMGIFAVSPLAPYCLSLGAMGIYSHFEEKDSLMADRGISIEIPSAGGWYPFVMTFNGDSGFRRFCGDPSVRLSIMYNFPEFDLMKGCSRIYDTDSRYYNAFYGAYCVSGDFGFDDNGMIDRQQAVLVPEYDMTHLVLRDMGMEVEDEVFKWSETPVSGEKGKRYPLAGYDGWQRIDADLTVNGVAHQRQEWFRNYIQYGSPGYDAADDFAPVQMHGRIYGRYFEEKDCGIFFYVLACDKEIIEEWEKEIMAVTTVSAGRT